MISDFARSNSTSLTHPDDFPHDYIRLEEFLAMMLDNERINAVKTGEFEWNSAVFTIWDNSMSVRLRKMLQSSIRLAGMTPLAFVHENTAAIVYNSMDKSPSTEQLKDETVFVINVGAFATKLSLMKIESIANGAGATNSTVYIPSIKVIKDAFNITFSGHLLDECLANFGLAKQLKQMKSTATKEELGLMRMRRLYNEIAKTRETLSANKETLLNLEDFFEDRSLSVKVSRVEFEENCESLFSDFERIIIDFMFEIEREKITRTEIIGGVVRTPKVQEILKSKFKLPISMTINGDEGSAFGAAFIAANNTVGLKMKKIIMNDGPNYAVNLGIEFNNGESASRYTELFPIKSNYGSKKRISIKNLKSDAVVALNVTTPEFYELRYNVTGIEKGLNKYASKNITDFKTVFNFVLDQLGLPRLLSAELVLKEEYTEVKNKTITSQNKTDGTNYTETVPENVARTNNYTYKLQIDTISETYKSLIDYKDLFEESKAFLKQVKKIEEDRKQQSEMKNKLESYIYKLKSDATEPSENKYLNATQRADFLEKSSEIDFLLYEGDASNLTRENIRKLTSESEELLKMLNFRRTEHQEREKVNSLWQQFLVNSTNAVAEIRKDRTWTPPEKITELEESIQSAKEELEAAYRTQLNLDLNVDPVFRSQDVSARVKKLSAQINKVGKIPKPKEPVKPVNATENLDELLKKAMKDLKYNMTGDNLTDEQIDEMLKAYKDKGIEEDVKDEEKEEEKEKEEEVKAKEETVEESGEL